MSLPTALDYQGAIQSPQASLGDAFLQTLRPDLGRQGLPLSWTGTFATVFRMRNEAGQHWALRCLTRNVEGLDARYRAFAAFREQAPPALRAALVAARYLPQGIRTGVGPGAPWWPVILMAWADGPTLASWVEQHRLEADRLRQLQAWLADLGSRMAAARFVHGDLQHKNVLVGAQGPVLVDYDNVMLPDVAGLPVTTDGLPSFRHPLGDPHEPLGCQDRFALLVLHVGLEALIQNPAWYDRWGRGEGLLFQGRDFRDPGGSPLFQALQAHPGMEGLARNLARVCQEPAGQTPALGAFLGAATGGGGRLGTATWQAANLDPFQRLFSASAQPQVRVHRFECGSQAGLGTTQAPVAQGHPSQAGNGTAVAPLPQPPAPHAGPGTPLAPLPLSPASPRMPVSRSAPPRRVRRMVAAALVVLGAGLAARVLLARARPAPAAEWAQARQDLRALLGARKEVLTVMIVGLDEDLERLRPVPDGLRLAVPDPAPGAPDSLTVAQMRQQLAQTRETARRALLQCDEVQEQYERVLDEGGLTPDQLAARLAGLPHLPEAFRTRSVGLAKTGRQP